MSYAGCDHEWPSTVGFLNCFRLGSLTSSSGFSTFKYISVYTQSPGSMSTLRSPSLLEELSIELLERICLFSSARDVLRVSMVRPVLKIPDSACSLSRDFERSTALFVS